MASSSATEGGWAAIAVDLRVAYRDGAVEPVFAALAEPRFGPGLETVYEGYLAHYGTPRLFEPADRDDALLLGDYLYAQGLTEVAALGEPAAVADLAELLSLCAELRGAGAPGDGAVWAASAALLGHGPVRRAGPDPDALEALAGEVAGAEPVARALAAHRQRIG